MKLYTKPYFIPLFFALILFLPTTALAGDAATIVFASGQVVRISDGFKDIVTAMEKLNQKDKNHHIVRLSIGGGTFLLNVAEAVIVCRDKCKTLEIVDKRDPARAG